MDGESAKLTLKAHALLLPAPFQGHINPFMELGQRLAALGVRVTLVTTQQVHNKILRAQQALSQPITARHANFSFIGIPDGLDPDLPHIGLELMQATQKLEDPVVELVHTLASQGLPVTCVVADYFLRWTPSLASRTCLPEFIFWPQCVSMLSVFLQMDAFIAAGYNPFDVSEGTRPDLMDQVTCIPGLPHQIRYADMPFHDVSWTWPVQWHEDLIRHRLKNLPKAQGVLVNSFEALEEEVCKALNAELQQLIPNSPASFIRFIGPLTASTTSEGLGASLWEEEVEECMQWLDKQPARSVMFVAFGSVATMSSNDQVQELAKGLVESGQRFLWVLRKDAIPFANLKIEDALPQGFLEETKGTGKVVHWAPQVRVLSHPAVGGFFSHCGWNSVLESINNGVPVLGWANHVDQFLNSRLVSHVWRFGLGLECNSLNEITRVGVAHGVREVMEGPHAEDMRAHAIQLKNLALEDAHSSREFLSLVDDIQKQSPSV